MKDFKNAVAVVTGAGSGIGRALAQQLAARGARVAIADVNEKGLAETAALIGTPVLTQKLDVADKAAVFAFAARVKQELGAADLVINNAGVAVSQTVADLSYEDMEWLMGINFWGVVHGTKAFLPDMLARDRGTLVNISSVFGIISVPTQGIYNASKFAVRGYTEALRHELEGSGVRAVCVHPGGIRTNIARSSRMYKDPGGLTDAKAVADRFEKIARTSPEKAAATILRGVERGSGRVLIGADAWLIDRIQRCLPVRYWKLMAPLLKLA